MGQTEVSGEFSCRDGATCPFPLPSPNRTPRSLGCGIPWGCSGASGQDQEEGAARKGRGPREGARLGP